MRSNTITRTRLVVLAALGAFAALVPTAGADTTLPVWTCRASAGYVEVGPLLGPQRVEPVLANGFPDRAAPDSAQCASSTTGANDVDVPGAGVGGNATPPINLSAAFANTTIAPQIAAARNQTATANGGVANVTITLGALVINATAVTAHAEGKCTTGPNPVPAFSANSTVASLSIINAQVPVPLPAIIDPAAPLTIPLGPLGTVYLNRTVVDGGPLANDEALTQRAVQIELLPLAGNPAVNIVLGEAKADRHEAVCAAAAPAPQCPPGYTAQNVNATPLVCLKTDTVTVTNNVPVPTPCGAGTAANASGVCIATATTCPTGTIREPNSNTCVLVVQRPCPAGATPDPATTVCVVRAAPTTGSGSGENGRVGSPTGPVATCGRLEMHFVRGATGNAGRSFTSIFGKRTVTRGQLVSCGANPRPIFGARVDVVHVLPNGQRRRKTGLRSREAGKLTLILPNNLRSRKIDYAYRPDLRSTRVTSRVILSLTVKNKRGRVLR
jgi:hypothetical protein